MGIITKYKFNQNTYADFIPEFNSEFTDYTITDETDTDGFTIRTIGNDSDNLPTLMRFGQIWTSGENGATDKSLSLLEVYECNTSNITDMNSMFRYCSNLILLDASNFNTSQVTNMSGMFYNCTSLISLDLSNFNTEKVTSMGSMFANCYLLTSLNISNFNTSQVTIMSNIFNNCSSLTSLDVSNFNTSQVTNMSNMFYNCSKLTSLDVSNFNTSQVTTMYAMFFNCSKLTLLDVSNFNTNQVTDMRQMFYGCASLTSLDVSHFNTNKVTDISNIFTNCSSLNAINVSGWNTSNVTNMNEVFHNCPSLTVLDVSDWNTNRVTSMKSMFQSCWFLTTLDISNFNISDDITYDNFLTESSSLKDVGLLYSSPNTINKIVENLNDYITIWHMDSKLEDLTKKENITYKEYKMNILESDEEINLRRIGDVCDELNLETGELTERIGEIVLDGNGFYVDNQDETSITFVKDSNPLIAFMNRCINNRFSNLVYVNGTIKINVNISEYADLNKFKESMAQNNLIIQFHKKDESIKTINLKGKPSIDWQGDTYLHLENNTLYPQLECEIESINYYEIPKLKANTLYTLRYVGEPTQCIFGGLTYGTENNMVLTSGSSDNLLYFDKEVRKVILIEGDVRDRNFDYFEGIESLGAVEIVVHKSDMPIFAKGGRK